jgi:hypothetical protein
LSESEIAALRAEAEWLVRTPWARERMPSIADALLRDRTLTGEQVRTLCEPLRAS